jgi:hypothetical protein
MMVFLLPSTGPVASAAAVSAVGRTVTSVVSGAADSVVSAATGSSVVGAAVDLSSGDLGS